MAESYLMGSLHTEIKLPDIGPGNLEKPSSKDQSACISVLVPVRDDSHTSSNNDFDDKVVRTIFIRKIYCILSVRKELRTLNKICSNIIFRNFFKQFQCVLMLAFKLLLEYDNASKQWADANIGQYVALGVMACLMFVNYCFEWIRRIPMLNLVLLGLIILTISFNVSATNFSFVVENVSIFVSIGSSVDINYLF